MLRSLLRLMPRLLRPSRFDADIDPFLRDDTAGLFD
ncbi:MAG: hypothetical protein JWN67_2616 [Actinomycetia bacterium]|nr:hypothetical protein [Actinomycetes bacterium]